MLVELIVTARMPARSAAAIWLRISASSGLTITVGPAPSRAQQQRRHEVDRRLAPPGALHDQRPPVADRERLDRRHWSSRSSASSRPTSARRCASASRRTSRSAVVRSRLVSTSGVRRTARSPQALASLHDEVALSPDPGAVRRLPGPRLHRRGGGRRQDHRQADQERVGHRQRRQGSAHSTAPGSLLPARDSRRPAGSRAGRPVPIGTVRRSWDERHQRDQRHRTGPTA